MSAEAALGTGADGLGVYFLLAASRPTGPGPCGYVRHRDLRMWMQLSRLHTWGLRLARAGMDHVEFVLEAGDLFSIY